MWEQWRDGESKLKSSRDKQMDLQNQNPKMVEMVQPTDKAMERKLKKLWFRTQAPEFALSFICVKSKMFFQTQDAEFRLTSGYSPCIFTT